MIPRGQLFPMWRRAFSCGCKRETANSKKRVSDFLHCCHSWCCFISFLHLWCKLPFFFSSFTPSGFASNDSFPRTQSPLQKRKPLLCCCCFFFSHFFFLQSPLNFWNERKVLKPVGVGSRGTLQGHWKKLTRHCLWITFYFNVKWTFGGYWSRREKDRSILEGQKKKLLLNVGPAWLCGERKRECVFCILLGYPFWTTMSHTRNAGAGVVVWEKRRL